MLLAPQALAKASDGRGNACRSARRSCSDAAVRPATTAGGLRGDSSWAPWTNRLACRRVCFSGARAEFTARVRISSYRRSSTNELSGASSPASWAAPSLLNSPLPTSATELPYNSVQSVAPHPVRHRRRTEEKTECRDVGSWGGRERRAAHRGAPEGRRERGKGETRSRQGGGGFYAGYAQPSVAF